MADLGSGIAAFGDNFARGMHYLQQQKQQIDLSDALFDLGSRMQMPDPTKPDKTIPVFDKKFMEAYPHMSRTKKAALAGFMQHQVTNAQDFQETLGRMGFAQQLQNQSPQGQLAKRTLDSPLVEDAAGNRFVQHPGGLSPISGGATTSREMGTQSRFDIKRAMQLRKELATEFGKTAIGLSPEDFLREDVVPGNMDDKGKFVPLEKGATGGNAVGIPQGGTYVPFDMKQWGDLRGKAAQYQKLGQIAFGGLSGGTQTAPVLVKTPAEARALPPGTLIQTPDGRVGRVKGRAPVAEMTETEPEEE